MRFLKILFSLLFAVSVALSIYVNVSRNYDFTPPVISCDTDEIEISVKDSDEKLLSFVTAHDEKDGDVTAEVFIEGISPFIDENKAVATFAVCDSDNNVAKKNINIIYTDYAPPEFYFEKQQVYYAGGAKVDLLAGAGAVDKIYGDISSRIVVSDSKIDLSQPGVYPVTYRVTTSMGASSEVTINSYVYSGRLPESIILTDYFVYADKDNQIVPEDYIEEYPSEYFEDDFRSGNYTYSFDIENEVDYTKQGIYYITYRLTRTQDDYYNDTNNEPEILAEAYLAVAVRGDN